MTVTNHHAPTFVFCDFQSTRESDTTTESPLNEQEQVQDDECELCDESPVYFSVLN